MVDYFQLYYNSDYVIFIFSIKDYIEGNNDNYINIYFIP